MKELFRNPHPFDMSSYFSGQTYMLGGRDFDHDENETKSLMKEAEKKATY